MVMQLGIQHDVGWLSPSPLWRAFGDLTQSANQNKFVRPTILRFANDKFTDELMATLAYEPEQLSQWQAQWESWEQPMQTPELKTNIPANEPISHRSVQFFRRSLQHRNRARSQIPSVVTTEQSKPLKLFQPIQNRFYLVSASLICRRAGLPDRRVDMAKEEKVSFVLRRLIRSESDTSHDPDNPASWDEHAFLPQGQIPVWRLAPKQGEESSLLVPGEERIPMFSAAYQDSENHQRKMFSGVIPVGRRETYIAASQYIEPEVIVTASNNNNVDESIVDTRELLFALQVLGPWREMVDQAANAFAKYDIDRWPENKEDEDFGVSSVGLANDINVVRQSIQTISWYVILDFFRFLNTHIPDVAAAIRMPPFCSLLSPSQDALVKLLENITYKMGFGPDLLLDLEETAYKNATIPTNLLQAIKIVADSESIQRNLEAAESQFTFSASTDWPNFLFPLADPKRNHGPFPFESLTADVESFFESLSETLKAALPPRTSSPQPEINIPESNSITDRDPWFVIRCVYERPNCGAMEPSLLSAATEPFQMANFFDPEAPARRTFIPTPFNISPAALRRYPKSATLVVSDMLCGQIKRIRQLTLGDLVLSVLPWPFYKKLPDVGQTGPCVKSSGETFGMLCSLSIPIVTLCALILLLIMVALFDLFFRWLPLLFTCFPVSGLGSRR